MAGSISVVMNLWLLELEQVQSVGRHALAALTKLDLVEGRS
jgi:hypothetical protein